MPLYTVRNRYSSAALPDFADALTLYRNQRLRGAAPVLVTDDPSGFTAEQDEAIDLANHESQRSKAP